jgi:hypothetical protein
MKYLSLIIPILFTVFAVTGHGFFFRAGVSASCAIILWIMSKQTVSSHIWWVIAALIVSIAADWFMTRKGVLVYFLFAIILFFMAHTGFFLFCLKNGRINWRFLLPVLTGYLIFFFAILFPAIKPTYLLVAVLAYLIISCFSLSAAVGLRLPAMAHWCFAAGIALLVFSDTIIALNIFVKYKDLNFLILPTYFASHVMVTLALLK